MPPVDAKKAVSATPATGWFYALGGKPQGPVDEEAIAGLLSEGAVTGKTKVWTKGAPGWRRLADTPLASLLPKTPPPPTPPSSSEPPAPTEEMPESQSPMSASRAFMARPPAAVVPPPSRVIALTVQPGAAARVLPASGSGQARADSTPGAAGGTKSGGARFWTARLGETMLGALAGRGIELKHFDWLMPLERLDLGDNRQITNAHCGATGNGLLHVFFHRPGEGFYYAALPVEDAAARVQSEPDGVRFTLDFPNATGLRTGTSPCLTADLLDGLTAGWLKFWKPAINTAWGKPAGEEFAVGRLMESAPAEGSFGWHAAAGERAVFFRPSEGGLIFLPETAPSAPAPRTWSVEGGVLEFLFRQPGEMPELRRLAEHAPIGESPALPRWLPGLNFGSAAKSDTSLGNAAGTQGIFEVLWEGAPAPVRRLLSISGDTLAMENPDDTAGGEIVFDRGGFVCDDFALAVCADGRCARLTLSDPRALDTVPRFAAPSGHLETWSDGTQGCGVLIQPDEGPPLPARFTLAEGRYSVGPFQNWPFHAGDRLLHDQWTDTLGSIEIYPGVRPEGPAAESMVELSLPIGTALHLWEEWEVARTRASLANTNVGGFYREFNESKKLHLMSVLFSEFVTLNRALDQGVSMETLTEKLAHAAEPGAESKGKETRNAVVSRIHILMDTLPRIKQKLETMASLYPYYWVQQEVEWLGNAFGPEVATGQETALRKRLVPLVRREVRTLQANLERSLAEIENAALSIEGLLTRNGTGSIFEQLTHDENMAHQIERAAQVIFPWWRVFRRALVTAQFEFSHFVDDENLLAMKRDRVLWHKAGGKHKDAAHARLVGALRARIIEERRNRFAEVHAGSGVRMLDVAADLEETIKKSARADVEDFIKSLRPERNARSGL